MKKLTSIIAILLFLDVLAFFFLPINTVVAGIHIWGYTGAAGVVLFILMFISLFI